MEALLTILYESHPRKRSLPCRSLAKPLASTHTHETWPKLNTLFLSMEEQRAIPPTQPILISSWKHSVLLILFVSSWLFLEWWNTRLGDRKLVFRSPIQIVDQELLISQSSLLHDLFKNTLQPEISEKSEKSENLTEKITDTKIFHPKTPLFKCSRQCPFRWRLTYRLVFQNCSEIVKMI